MADAQAGDFTADNCADATNVVGEGAFSLNNSSAMQDGPPHTACVRFGEDQIDRDVWGCWMAPCTSTVFVQTCGLTTVDTRIAVYEGCSCPVTDARLLSCNDDRCDLQSLTTFEATAGQSYLIRVGTFPREPGGVGSVSITCGLEACPGTGDCFTTNGSPGCDDETCCETTCSIDPICCESQWDEFCAQEAAGLCTGGFDSCQAGSGDCTVERNPVCLGGSNDGLACTDDSDCPDGGCMGSPGCSDVDCCNTICREDPFCCINTWDTTCVNEEAQFCFSACGAGSGNCFTARPLNSDQAGCEDIACCAEVCPRDIFCCQVEWDSVCAERAIELCTLSAGCPTGDVDWIDPPNGVVDAGYPVNPDNGNPLGIDTIIVQAPPGADRSCWTPCETDSTGLPNDILSIDENSGVYTIRLIRPITPGAVTTITYTNDLGGTATGFFIFHPANIDGDDTVSSSDVSALINILLGVSDPSFGLFSADIDRSGNIHPADILAEINLLNGAHPFSSWDGTTLPISANVCP